MPSRRDVLVLGGTAVAALAGCLGGSPSGVEPPRSRTRSDPTETADPTPDADVRLRDVTVTPTLVAANSPDSIGTCGARGAQYVVVGVGSRRRLPFDREEFALSADGETYDPTTARDERSYGRLWGVGDPYDPDSGGTLLFDVPKPLDVAELALRWPGGERRLAGDFVARLRRPPTTFAVRAFDAPDAVRTGTAATLKLTVENVGSADGTFVAGLNRVGPEVAYLPVEAVSVDVPAGESRTWTHSYTPSVPAPDEDLRFEFVLNWRGGDERATVGVEPAE